MRGVFVPRASAQPILEAASELGSGAARLLDCGTGSGCLALSFLRRHQGAEAVAIDLDLKAVRCAETNAQHLGLASRLQAVKLLLPYGAA